MSLRSGARIGAYEIVAPLGAGGMGEVYRARDTRLGREVAIKCLPEAFVADSDRLMRFEREARTLAALNHPHIAHVYGLEESAGTRALIMELIDGDDLAERINRGPIPLEEALAIARQIVEALEAAHNAGIVHRDLKPANIKVREDGTVKVLDFGLAKAVEATGSTVRAAGDGILNSPTITSPAMTAAGIILGTAAYMSPEQAKGKVVDKRTDVWAFGCVLYEMLTGKRAFDGDDVTDTLAAILRGDPDWSALASFPPVLQMLVKRCVDRDTRRRIGDISAVRFVLDDPTVFVVSPAGSGPTRAPAAPVAPATAPPRLGRARAVSAALIAVAALSAFATYILTRRAAPASEPTPISRFILPLPQGQVLAMSRRMMTLSPDGRTLVFVTENRLFMRRLSNFDTEPLPGTDVGQGVTSPVFSPDGTQIAFHVSSQGLIKRIGLQGGAALRVCDMPAVPLTINWDEGGILIGAGGRGILRCNPAGGTAEEIVNASSGEAMMAAQTVPGGKAVLFSATNADSVNVSRWEEGSIVLQVLASGERRVLVKGASDPRVTSTGHLIYRSAGILFAIPFDTESLQTRGEAVPMIEGIMRASTGPTQMALSANGTIVYMPGLAGNGDSERQLTIADRAGAATSVALPAGPYWQVRVAPDGNQVVLAGDNGKDVALWVYGLNGASALRRLTLSGNNRFPIWSPDSQWIAYQSDRDGDAGIYRQRADGSGSAERLTTAEKDSSHIPESWSPDGKVIAYAIAGGAAKGAFSLSALALDNKKSIAVGITSAEPIGAVFSPNGRWIAYTRTDSDDISTANRGVFVQPFPPNGTILQAPRQLVDFHPVWSPDGGELIYLASVTARQMAAMKVTPSGGGSLSFGAPTRFPARVVGDRLSLSPRAFDIMPDGRFIGLVGSSEAQTTTGFAELRVVINWFEELRQRVH